MLHWRGAQPVAGLRDGTLELDGVLLGVGVLLALGVVPLPQMGGVLRAQLTLQLG